MNEKEFDFDQEAKKSSCKIGSSSLNRMGETDWEKGGNLNLPMQTRS